jgi:hypothetical protein
LIANQLLVVSRHSRSGPGNDIPHADEHTVLVTANNDGSKNYHHPFSTRQGNHRKISKDDVLILLISQSLPFKPDSKQKPLYFLINAQACLTSA